MNTKEKINSLICLTLLLQLTFYFTSCKTSEVQNNNQLIYKGKKEFGDVSDFMDALKPFVIETSDDIVIAPSFIRIIENDGIFYAVDRFRRNIIGFDINGLIKFRFESLGMGNLDYSRIADIAWNQDKDCLMLLDSNKILLIDKEANAFEAIQLDSFYDSFSYCNGNIYLTNTQSINGEHTPFSVSVINKNGEISQLLPSLFDYSPYCFTGGCNIVNIDNEIMYTRKFDDNIYNLSVSNEFDVWYNLDLKDLKFTPEKKTYE
ncbi:MAG: 6-bladed beta-propeller, partial [Muribaculaceae bacterium]|nr:6-bladed beta-propeller [Muribaculaceae bacterium]